MKKDAYLGINYEDDRVLGAINKYCASADGRWGAVVMYYKKYSEKDLYKKVAELIAEQNIVGWFQGASETGPRALGNRSILADARSFRIKDRINESVKHREWYRPFAPSCLEEEADKYFTHSTHSPHMLLISDVKHEWRSRLPAITHVDGTARLQTVSKETNPKYWKLINAFKNLTGIPVILNTSFNDNSQPIVETPENAIDCFYDTQMDYLVMHNYIISKRERNWYTDYIKPKDKKRRVGIVCFSYNRSDYLEKTLDSLVNTMDKRDKVFLLEQSSDIEEITITSAWKRVATANSVASSPQVTSCCLISST